MNKVDRNRKKKLGWGEREQKTWFGLEKHFYFLLTLAVFFFGVLASNFREFYFIAELAKYFVGFR